MVQTSAYSYEPADPYGLLEGGRKAISFATKDANGFTQHSPIGTSFTGLITGDLRRGQIIDFETKKPKFWNDGRPQEQIIMDLQTDLREDELDDGVRTLYAKGQMLAALQEALRATRHLGRIGEGSRITVTLVDYKNTGKGNPQKIYQVQVGPEFVPYTPPEARQVQAALGYQPVQPVAPQYVQPQAPQAPQQHPQPVAPQAPMPPVQQVAPQQLPYGGSPTVAVPPQPPVQQYAPQQVDPAPATAQPSPALQAINALAAQPVVPPPAPAQPAAPAQPQAPVITQEHIDAYGKVIAAGIDPQTAISSLTEQLGAGPDFSQALAAAVGVLG